MIIRILGYFTQSVFNKVFFKGICREACPLYHGKLRIFYLSTKFTNNEIY